MQFEKFTGRARCIVDLASAEAERLGHAPLDTVHLLLGMILEGKGIAAVALSQYDIDTDSVIRAYDAVRAESDVTFNEVEAWSHLEADWFGHSYPGTEHLLLAVCCLTDCRAARLLEKLGKHPVQLCHFVVDILGRLDDWDRWLTEHPDLAQGR